MCADRNEADRESPGSRVDFSRSSTDAPALTTPIAALTPSELEEWERLARALIDARAAYAALDENASDYEDMKVLIAAEREYNTVTTPARILALLADARALRQKWWLLHGCPITALYGDDGEMQCNGCMIDFKRWTVEEIDARITEKQQERYRDDPVYRAKIDAVFAAFNPEPAIPAEDGAAHD